MKFVNLNSSIECISAIVISRDIKRSSFMEIKSIGKCLTYKCKLNSEAKIEKELSPKEAIHNQNSSLNKDDKLECQDLFFATQEKRNLKVSVINYTGTHKAQLTETKSYTYAEISRQIPNIPVPKNTSIEFKPSKGLNA